MSLSGANNIKIQPVNAIWQIKAMEQLDLAGKTGADVKGTSFNLNLPDGSVWYVWGDDGVVADPAVTPNAIPYTIVGDSDTATVLAAAIAAAIQGTAGFTATSTGTIVDISRSSYGEVVDMTDNDSLIKFAVCRRGKDYEVGLMEGDVSFDFSPATLQITAHQSGLTPRAALMQGVETIEASMTMLETNKEKLQELYKVFGGISGALYGVGTSKNGNNLLLDAARLKLRPVNAVDASEDTVIMLCLPNPSSLVFSGESARTLELTWSGYVDETYADKTINVVGFGDVDA